VALFPVALCVENSFKILAIVSFRLSVCVGRLNGWYIIYHCSIIVVVVFSSLCVSLGKEII
jgi:hypothetical protein